MKRANDHSCKIRLSACILLLSALSGCSYQAQLLDLQNLQPDATVDVQCNIIKKPVIKVSEMGDFIFWAGGPGPMTWCIAKVLNETNNDRYRKMLKPALDTDFFCENFQANLKEAVEEIGLNVKRITIEYKNPGIPLFSNVRDCNTVQFLPENTPHKYVLQLKISCGLYKSEAKPVAQIEGRLIRLDDKKLLWKNQLSFEARASAEHKAFGDGKKAVKEWEKDCVELQNCLHEVLAGVTDLLAREFTLAPSEQQQKLTKFKLKDGSTIKADIINYSPHRFVLRLHGGSLRSIPADILVTTKP